MPPSSFLREKYLVTCRFRWVDVHYADLPPPDDVLMLFVTNLRNRPLSISVTESMWDTVLSLYHNLVTGSKDFPFINFHGELTSFLLESPFNSMQQEWENATPSPLTAAPPGMMVPTSGSGSAPANIFTPVLPEKTELGALKADRRNHVQLLQVGSSTVTRVISPVYRSDNSELTNRWRVTDYSAEGQVLMSVLCRFFNHPAQSARPLSQKRAREDTEEDGGSSSPAGKRLRV